MRNRNDNDMISAVNFRQCKDDRARTILGAFISTLLVLAEPKKGIADDKTSFGLRPVHGFQSFNSAFR